MVSAPQTEAELLARAAGLAGMTLGTIAAELRVRVPEDLRRAKGWVGNLLELALGATAKSRAVPDFELLRVELKSIPVDRRGQPLETTFVCTIPLTEVGDHEWEHSRVHEKLRRVLWVPVLGERAVPVGERVVGSAHLWSPTKEQESQLRWDWEELAGLIGKGDFDAIHGRLGQVMQVRPKAADSYARRAAHDAEGRRIEVLPRGFYLRTAFTASILRDAFLLPERDE